MSISLGASAHPDTLQKFIFDNAAVRGEFVDISATWRDVLSRHAYPPAVKKVLGEMVAAAALLSANLKFNGSIIMQIHGDGPVRLMVVECDAEPGLGLLINLVASTTLLMLSPSMNQSGGAAAMQAGVKLLPMMDFFMV